MRNEHKNKGLHSLRNLFTRLAEREEVTRGKIRAPCFITRPWTDIGTGLVLTATNSPAEVILDGGGKTIDLKVGTGSVITSVTDLKTGSVNAALIPPLTAGTCNRLCHTSFSCLLAKDNMGF
jgi:hypothetical protein